MDLYHELLAHMLANEELHITFPNLQIPTKNLIHDACYNALCEIKSVLENDDLSDPECFDRIEEIVRIYEQLGTSCAGRHDFG